ncbi:reactive intermediate/imine deaminase [Priestia megaterium]|uniref:RidA family protein n=1 Tax=Priestia megaterium TaxID=1404 RepID=UPI000BF4C3FC|nr:RidA family protein [Priestia megaterium]PFB04614.1 reactive intermediate/imine deaminase [Priestia megaterium]
MIKTISTDKAPQAIGPYSQAIKTDNVLYLSGQIPINPETSEIISNDIAEQTGQVMKNIKAILEKESLSIEKIVKTTIFLQDLSQFNIVNEEYSKFLGDHRPARSTIEVSRLPKDVQIEIEAIAYIK